MEVEEREQLRTNNPEFAKLLDVISGTYLEDGMPKITRTKLKEVEMKLHSVKQQYLEHLLLTEELGQAICTLGEATSAPDPSSKTAQEVGVSSEGSRDLRCSAAQLHHSLVIGTEETATVLGVGVEHLRRVALGSGQEKISGEILHRLERSLTEKCLKIVRWHAPQKEGPSSSDSTPMLLAKIQQLPQLLMQQREEMAVLEREKKEGMKRCREIRAKGVTVLSDMCREMRTCLERSKLELCVWSNDASLSYLQAEMRALIGKLDMIHYQLIQGICSDGRLQALTKIRSHLLEEHKRLSEELSQTKQVIRSYEALGEEFLQLSQQYHSLKEEIENKQWALSELTKTMT